MPDVTELAPIHLTERQRTFAEEYVRTGFKQRAAIKAGFSPKTADVQATHLTNPDRHPDVVRYIEQLRLEKRARMSATSDRIELELARIAYLDPADLVDSEGNLLALQDMPEDARRAIGRLKLVKREVHLPDGETKVVTTLADAEPASKLGALRQLQELKGLVRGVGDRVQINNVNQVAVSWEALGNAPVEAVQADTVEQRLALEDEAPDAGDAVEPGLDGIHETNGQAGEQP